MASSALLPTQDTGDHRSHQNTENASPRFISPRKLKRNIEDVAVISTQHLSNRQDGYFFLGLSQTWVKPEPMYALSSYEDDPLMEISQPQSESSFSSFPITDNEWHEIQMLSEITRQLPVEEGEEGEEMEEEEAWTPIGAWLASSDLHERLLELTSDEEEVYDEEEEEVEVEKEEDKNEREENEDEESVNNDNCDALARSVIDRLSLSVVGQWNASSMENSIDSLKLAVRKAVRTVATPEGSVVIGKDHNGRWLSLLRL